MDRQRIEWLNNLICAYEGEHDWEQDCDHLATEEMLRECRFLLGHLRNQYPVEPDMQEITIDLGSPGPFDDDDNGDNVVPF